MAWILIALIACFQAIVCINFYSFHKGSVMSFAIWHIIICAAYIAVIFNWKRLSAIKPE